MPYIIRTRKDIVDPRPIRIRPGPSFYNYYWKVMALFDLNDKGEFVLPFSRRLVHTNRLLWPRSHKQPPPSGYELCGCIGCENKTYEDHILNDYDDDDDPGNGNLHIEEVYVESDDDDDDDNDEKDEKLNETQEEDYNHNDDDDGNGDENEDEDDDDNWYEEMMSDPPSPFACDPYESFDYEC